MPDNLKLLFLFSLGIVLFSGVTGKKALAHCDTLEGPVVQSARIALESGDVTPVLKWVREEDEDEIREAFERASEVRTLNGEARGLADRYFFETLVRIHRAGEGAPYTGLRPGAAVDPAIILADEALESGSAEKLVKTLTEALENGVRERFRRALQTKSDADTSVESGREFVEAYVTFTHYVEELHAGIKSTDLHHVEGEQ